MVPRTATHHSSRVILMAEPQGEWLSLKGKKEGRTDKKRIGNYLYLREATAPIFGPTVLPCPFRSDQKDSLEKIHLARE